MQTTSQAKGTITAESTEDVVLLRTALSYFRDNYPTEGLSADQRVTLSAMVDGLDPVK